MKDESRPLVGREIEKSSLRVSAGDAGNGEPQFGDRRVESERLQGTGDRLEL